MKTKRILSLLLCVCMLCGIFAVGASAEDAPTRVLNDFDGIGEYVLHGPNNQGFSGAMSVYDYTQVDPEYTGGNVLRLYGKDAVNYSGWTYNFDSSWASADYDTPVALKFQLWANKEVVISGSGSGLTANSTNSWTPTDVKSTFKSLGLNDFTATTEPTWYTLDFTNLAVPYTSRLGMRITPAVGQWEVYIDNITLVYEDIASRKASFDVEGIEDITADLEGNVVLPSATVEGKQFIGWQDEKGAVHKAGTTVRLSKSTAFTAVTAELVLQTGAGIRWAQAESERGIRFETYVTKAALDTLGSSSFELGALILPYENYQADITVENNYGAVNVVDPKVYGEVGENYRYYTGVVDFEKYFAVSQSALADLKLTAVSYIKVTYADASTAYFYDHPDATDNVRTVAEVARAALADTEFPYSEKQIEILNLYKQYSLEDTVPAYRNDAKDNVNFAEEVEYPLTDCVSVSGSGFNTGSHDNGAAINEYTPTGAVTHYYNSAFAVGNTFSFTLPKEVATGNYTVSFNTRGYTGRASAKVEVTSNAGTAVAADSQSFSLANATGGVWYNVACPNVVEISGETTITLTSTAQGSIYLYDVVLTPAQ